MGGKTIIQSNYMNHYFLPKTVYYSNILILNYSVNKKTTYFFIIHFILLLN